MLSHSRIVSAAAPTVSSTLHLAQAAPGAAASAAASAAAASPVNHAQHLASGDAAVDVQCLMMGKTTGLLGGAHLLPVMSMNGAALSLAG